MYVCIILRHFYFFILIAVSLRPWHTLFGGVRLCLLLLAVVVFLPSLLHWLF